MSRMFKNTAASKLKPELMAALFSPAKQKPPQEFLRELDRYGVSYSISDTIYPRVVLSGSDEEGLKKCRALLAETPEIEAWLIVHEATKDETLLDVIQERACIRWSEGLSDRRDSRILRPTRYENGGV